MKNFLDNKWGKIILAIIFVSLGSYVLIDKYKFPVEYIICSNSSYSDCFVAAKYPSMNSCQREVETGNWQCDSLTDPENIKCRPDHDSSVVAYCDN